MKTTRTYLPLSLYSLPDVQELSNGVRVASRHEVAPASMSGFGEALTGMEIRDLSRWHWALFHETSSRREVESIPPETLLQDSHLAFQVLNPQGNFLNFCLREQDAQYGSPLITRLPKFEGTPWSRISSVASSPYEDAKPVLEGVLDILNSGDARIINPLRLFEHAMTGTNPYIRVLLWITAVDGMLMAVKKEIFIRRLYGLLGEDSLIFQRKDDLSITRTARVRDLAEDLFELRSEVAHGHPIKRKFWEIRTDLAESLPPQVYDEQRYIFILEEAALEIFCATFKKIVLNGLLDEFKKTSLWRRRLKNAIGGWPTPYLLPPPSTKEGAPHLAVETWASTTLPQTPSPHPTHLSSEPSTSTRSPLHPPPHSTSGESSTTPRIRLLYKRPL